MNWWFHCNACGRGTEVKRDFYLTHCGHAYCSECAKGLRQCKVCGAKSPRLMKLGQGMKPEIKRLFDEPAKSMKTMFKACEFQMKQSKSQVALLKKKIQGLNSELSEAKLRETRLKEELESLKAHPKSGTTPQQIYSRIGGPSPGHALMMRASRKSPGNVFKMITSPDNRSIGHGSRRSRSPGNVLITNNRLTLMNAVVSPEVNRSRNQWDVASNASMVSSRSQNRIDSNPQMVNSFVAKTPAIFKDQFNKVSNWFQTMPK